MCAVCCGAIKSPADERDWIYEGLAQSPTDAEIPEEFSMKEYMNYPKDQGSRGTCAAFVGAAIKSINHRRSTDTDVEFSTEFIYYNRQNRPASGMFGRNVFSILQKMGTPPESKYPYGTQKKPSSSVYNMALNYRIHGYAKIVSADGLKRALYELGPCYLLLPLYSTRRSTFWRPKKGEESAQGHAVLVIGYNSDGFIIINSWGPTWNGDGTAVIPYNHWNSEWECWVAMEDEIEMVRSDGKRKRRKGKCEVL